MPLLSFANFNILEFSAPAGFLFSVPPLRRSAFFHLDICKSCKVVCRRAGLTLQPYFGCQSLTWRECSTTIEHQWFIEVSSEIAKCRISLRLLECQLKEKLILYFLLCDFQCLVSRQLKPWPILSEWEYLWYGHMQDGSNSSSYRCDRPPGLSLGAGKNSKCWIL